MKHTDKGDKFVEFGIISESETRELSQMICPYCHEVVPVKDNLSLEYEGAIEFEGSANGHATCPNCLKTFTVWADLCLYSQKSEELLKGQQ